MGKKKRKTRNYQKQQAVQTVVQLHDEPKLNEHQQQAVDTTEGPLLLIAGAGSGKTYTILRRIAHLIMDKHVSPYNILAVTFTNKAAAEMKERLAQILGPTIAMPTVCTFHSFGAMAVNRFYDSIGYKKNISICDAKEWKKRIQEQAKKMDINETTALEYGAKISRWKDYLIRPEDLVPDEMEYGFEKDAAEFYLEYQKKLKKDNTMDFDDLIMKTVEALHDEKVLSYFQNRYLYITVDEYQDTSHAQFELMRLLADRNKNICVVGDDYQSIYAFRGADISNILDFQQVYPHSKKIVLGENYRSTQTIVNAVWKQRLLRSTVWVLFQSV